MLCQRHRGRLSNDAGSPCLQVEHGQLRKPHRAGQGSCPTETPQNCLCFQPPIHPARVCLRNPEGRMASSGHQPWEAGGLGTGPAGEWSTGEFCCLGCPGSEALEGCVAGRAGGSGQRPAGADLPWLYSRWTSRTVSTLADLRKRPSERSPAGREPPSVPQAPTHRDSQAFDDPPARLWLAENRPQSGSFLPHYPLPPPLLMPLH